jgi:hypothetical protein
MVAWTRVGVVRYRELNGFITLRGTLMRFSNAKMHRIKEGDVSRLFGYTELFFRHTSGDV